MSAANILNSPINASPAITTPYASGGGGGAGVASINGATGAITIAAGSGIGVATVGTTVTITNTGGGGGLFLPLAGGTMDPLPAGIITAHTINEIARLTGISNPAASTFVIETAPAGANILIDATASSDSVDIHAFTTNIESDISAPIGLDVQGAVSIQPIPGYIYPDNAVPIPGADVNVGLQIKDWANANLVGGTVFQAGLATLNISSVNGQTYGMVMDTITSTNSDATGIQCSTITAGGTAYGIITNTITSAGSATGLSVGTITGDAQATGISVNSIDANNVIGSGANAVGVDVSIIQGDGAAYGVRVQGVDATANPNNGAPATGIDCRGVNADGPTTGILVGKILGNNIYPVRGIDVSDVRGTDNITGTGGNDVVGIAVSIVQDSVGTGPSTGLRIEQINNPNANGLSKGIDMFDINNDSARGMYMTSITGMSAARGVDMFQVSAKDEVIGYHTEELKSVNGIATGFNSLNVSSDNSDAYGLHIEKVGAGNGAAGGGVAYGINVDNLNGTARVYGIRIGSSLSAPVGASILGFIQEGTPGTKVRNILNNELTVGNVEDANTGISLKVAGNAFYKAQYITGGGSIQGNGGNLIVLAGGGGYLLSLPSVNAKEGHQYTLCMTAIANITLNAGGVLVNGGATYVLPGITAPNNKMWQAFYTTGSGVGQWYVG